MKIIGCLTTYIGNSSRYTNKELKKLVKLEAAGLESVDEVN
jgi:hypothetical protein